MSLLRSLFGGGERDTPPQPAYTVQGLKVLNFHIQSAQPVTEANRKVVVHNIRQLAELVIYGSQNSEKIFDYFCEANMMETLVQLLSQRPVPRGFLEVKTQIVQTISISKSTCGRFRP